MSRRARPEQRDSHAIELQQQLARIAFEQARHAADRRGSRTPRGSRVPVNPPMPWTPNTSSELS